VLIIIFMVMLPEHSVGLPAEAPLAAAEGTPAREQDIVVSVNRDHSIAINQQPVAIEQLQERLRDIFARRGSKVMFLQGDKALEFQEIARVIDLARGVGIFQIGLMTD
jgi:biopolymer transport protein ExbD